MEERNKKIIIIASILVIIAIGGIVYFNNQEEYTDIETFDEINEEEQIKENVNNVENEQQNTNETVDDSKIIAIHITGEIKKPGILYLKEGARIADAIKEAGGATKNANLDKVNLAYILSDGQKIYIPNKNEDEEEISYIISNSGENILVEEGKISEKGEMKKVNINTANQTELETLPGIGPSLAQRIIEYRETNGNFQSIEDLQNVKGIGDNKFSNMKDNVCI